MKKTLLLSLFVALTIVATAQTQRTVLLEHFTQASCGPCASQNPLVKQYFDATSTPAIAIKYQTSWPGFDPMNLHNPTQIADRVSYYGVTGVPNAFIDGYVDPVSNNNLPGNLFAGGNCPDMDARAGVASDFEISAFHDLSSDLSTVNVNVVVTAKNTVNNANLVTHIAIVEKEIIFASAPGSNGETEFYNVMKQMLPTSAGTALAASYTNGQTEVMSESWVHSNVYDLTDLAVVVFIQDNSTKEVFQAAFSEFITLPAGVQNADVAVSNPAVLASAGYCDGTYTPSVEITNNSSANLTSVDVSYDLNGTAGPVQTVAVNAGASTTVSFPGIVVASGDELAYSSSVSDAGFTDFTLNNNTAAPAAFVLLDANSDNGETFMTDFQGMANGDPYPAGSIADNPDGIRAFFVDASIANLSYDLGGNGNSDGCFRWDFYAITSGSSQLVFEEVDLSAAGAPMLNFTYAHAQYGSEADALVVKASSDCGATWTEVFNESGSDLATAGTVSTGRFYPTAGQWEDVSVSLADFNGMTDVVIAFEGISAYGNSLYVDDINTSGTVSTENVVLETSLNVFPNPTVDNFNVEFSLTETEDLTINLVNAIGQTVKTIETGSFVAGEHRINVNATDLAAGTYFVTIRNEAGVTTKTLTIQK